MTDPTTPLEPILLPATVEGWRAFASERADEHLDRAEAIIASLKAEPGAEGAAASLGGSSFEDAGSPHGSPYDALALLRRFDEAEFALASALHAAELISESHPEQAIREAAEARIERGSAIVTGISIDRELWRVFDAADPSELDADAARRYDDLMRGFRRGGVALGDAERERVRVLHERDTELGLTFSRNIRDGRREIRVAKDRLAGLPQDFVDGHEPDADGLVTLSTEYPDLMPVREYAQDRALREELTAAYNDLAWPENEPVLAELLEVRQELASLLGYTDWADYETETRMIGRGAAIPEFLARVAEVARDAGAAEYGLLLERLRRDRPDAEAVTTADFAYLLGVLKREEYAVDAQQVRSYFAFDGVLEGLLAVTGRLFELEYRPVRAPAWHEDVRAYDVHRAAAGADGGGGSGADGGTGAGERIGRFYLDLHPREGKYNHAACFGLAPGQAGAALPEGALLCNFSRGLMEHDEVVTFFHEFGHLVHGIVGGHQRWVRFSGIETEWDFVEAPSQMLEEWAWDPGVLASFARNAEGEPIPAELVARMRRADAFGRALGVQRQLGLAGVSYGLHVDRPADLQAATEGYQLAARGVRPLPGGHFYAGFGHLTGYGACYYTYQWSLVIARDLLSAFRAAPGGLMDPAIARRYRDEVLAPGGSRDAADLVRAFLGRDYAFDSYREWLAGS